MGFLLFYCDTGFILFLTYSRVWNHFTDGLVGLGSSVTGVPVA